MKICFVLLSVLAIHICEFSASVAANELLQAVLPIQEICGNHQNIVKCFKSQATKLLTKVLKASKVKIASGVYIENRKSPITKEPPLQDQVANTSNVLLSSRRNLNDVLHDHLARPHLQIHIPKLFEFGRKKSSEFVEEGRKKMKKYFGPFIAAVLLKAAMLKMAYHSIAIVAGKALIVGKIALIISAIIGLKKLVSSDSHEKTTYEIVKHPQFQQSHTYSSSHNEYEPHESTGSYHRSISNEEMLMQDKAYQSHALK